MTRKRALKLGFRVGLRASVGRTRAVVLSVGGTSRPSPRDGQVRAHAASLSSPATTAARAEPELHVPAGLTRLQAVEGAEVVLPVWYTLRGEVSSTQPWEVLTLQWFLKQERKELNQVREESVLAQSICARWGRREHLTAGSVGWGGEGRRGRGWGEGRGCGAGRSFQGKGEPSSPGQFCSDLEGVPKEFFSPIFPRNPAHKTLKSEEAFYFAMGLGG